MHSSFITVSSTTRSTLVVLSLFVFGVWPPGSLTAQRNTSTPLPMDSLVTIDTLPNGLRYYIRANGRPENRAELRLILDAGSILEDDDQLGLAHFVEHMAFNGTSRFPKQELIDYLEGVGMRFGAHLNASTSFDYTAYLLTIPTDSPEVMETAMAIMRDWAGSVAFDSLEIEKERGVVLEEWRLGRGADARIQDQQFPVLFRGSRYADRLPIGSPESLRSFSHEALKRFYTDWYRPNLMAVVAVGDFDPVVMERLIQENFQDLRNPADNRIREEFGVPSHVDPMYSVATDREMTSTSVALYYKGTPEQPGTVGAYRDGLVARLYRSMLNERLYEISQQPDAPFLYATVARARFVRPLEVFFLGAGVKDGEATVGLGSILREAERVARHGFAQSELDRNKERLRRNMERANAEGDKTRSPVYAGEYVRHFLEGEVSPGINFEYAMVQDLLPSITLEDVNAIAGETLNAASRVVLVGAPDVDSVSVPSTGDLAAVFDEILAEEVSPYVEDVTVDPLLPNDPVPGSVIAEHHLSSINVTEWTLSNGIRVIIKPTDFQNDQVLFQATSPGGYSLVADSVYVSAMMASSIIMESGLGSFSRVDLDRRLSGKAVSVFPDINDVSEGLSGGASPDDLEVMFQLIYLYFTAPRTDSTAYQALQQRMQEFVRNRDMSPEVALNDTLTAVMTQRHFRTRPFTRALFDEMDLDESMSFYRDRFEDASDFTFVFVGNVSPDGVRPLVEMYLGGLPAVHRVESWRDVGIQAPRGVIRKVVRRGLEPKAQTSIRFEGRFEGDNLDRIILSSMSQLLNLRLREVLREDLGGTYGASVWSYNLRIPRATFTVGIDFGSDPNRVDELIPAVFAEIDRLKVAGPTEEDLRKVVEGMKRDREVSERENGFWRSRLVQRARFGEPLEGTTSFADLLERVSREDIKEAAARYLTTDSYVLVTLLPEETVNN